ncbi:MAG: hypothetical protein JWQ69_5324 [Pseudomonas sp.]|nr:hypothetical protein [Pseudomonas sp.]
MKLRALIALAATAGLLSACVQQPSHNDIKDVTVLPYVQAHGVQVSVQLSAKDFVTASTVIDTKAALDAQRTSQNLVSSGKQAGLIGLAVVSLINTQVGNGSLQRDAENAARTDAKPMASLLSGMPLQEELEKRFQQAAVEAGIKRGQGQITGQMLIQPQLRLTPDRSSFVLINQVRITDIAGSSLYQSTLEVVSQTFRRCGQGCVDDGGLDSQKVMAVLDECVNESMRVLAEDLALASSKPAPQQTIRYVLDGQRVVERGYLLPTTGIYSRYRNLEGALKSVPVPFEQPYVGPATQQISVAQ